MSRPWPPVGQQRHGGGLEASNLSPLYNRIVTGSLTLAVQLSKAQDMYKR